VIRAMLTSQRVDVALDERAFERGADLLVGVGGRTS
jgi:hypothetical protein